MKKIEFKDLVENIKHFLEFPEIEDLIEKEINDQTENVLLTITTNGSRPPEAVLFDYLENDPDEEKLKAVIALSGGSLEKLKRIISFWFTQGTTAKVGKDPQIRNRVASFLNHPHTENTIPRFVRNSFLLPENWIDLLNDRKYMSRKFRENKVSHYSVQMGFKLENLIGERINKLGYSWEKGSVLAVDNKEVDLAIPNLDNPQILIMVSYSLTTSSSQTSRANEQSRMYSSIRTYNGRRSRDRYPDCLLVNFMEGGGWKSRRSDLKVIWKNSDFCFTTNTLESLEELVKTEMGKLPRAGD